MDDQAPQIIKKWLDAYAQATGAGQMLHHSAGAGPGREYAYLHYVTRDDRHHILLFRAIEQDGHLEVIGETFDGSANEVQVRVLSLTRGDASAALS